MRRLVLDGGRRESIRRIVEDRIKQMVAEDKKARAESKQGRAMAELEVELSAMQKKHRAEEKVLLDKYGKLEKQQDRKLIEIGLRDHYIDHTNRVTVSKEMATRIGHLLGLSGELANRIEFMDPERALAEFDEFKGMLRMR